MMKASGALSWIFALLAVTVGAFLAVQAGVNVQLTPWIGHPLHAAFVSFAVGTLGLLVIALLIGQPWPSARHVASAPWWVWTGGLLGGAYIMATVLVAPRLGAAVMFSLVVVGQMLASLILDHFGLLGYPQHAVNPLRLLGAALLVAGVALIRSF